MNYLNELKKLEILHVDNYQYIEIKKLNKDEYLLHQGEKLNYIYILLRGKMKVNHINANGNSMLCSFNSPYSIIGDLEFITQSPIINNVIAYEDCICATISLSKYHEILFVHKAEFVDEEDKKIEYTLKNIEGEDWLKYEWLDISKIDEYPLLPTSIKSVLKENKFPVHKINKDI